MIIHLAPDAPLLVRAAAGTALALHISGASAGLIFGSVALIARKGQRLHRLAGNIFFVSMLTMSGVAAVAAPFLPDRASALMGVLVFYLTATAWAVVQRRPGVIGRFERGAAVVPWFVAAGYFAFAWIGGHMPRGVLDGEPSQMGYVFGALAVLAGACDISMIRRGGVAGPQRIARHLWRMTLALAVAWGSFAGQPKAQPIGLRGSDLLIIPALVVLIALFVWLAKTLIPRRRRAAAAMAAA
jgi:uncharacterized membrane protein